MGAPAANCQTTDAAVAGNTCNLSAEAVDTGLGDWMPLLNFRPPAAVKNADIQAWNPAAALPMVSYDPYCKYGYQPIDLGTGNCNMDMYIVDILETPATFPDGSPFSVDALFEQFRQKLPDLLDHSVATMTPYRDVDKAKWASTSPLGTVGRFSMKGATWFSDPGSSNPTSPDACVVCTDYASDHWIFSTLQIPALNATFNGVHPVNGNRQFGFGVRKQGESWSYRYDNRVQVRKKDTLFWYTRGVDRCANIKQFSAAPEAVFGGGHDCWLGLQKNCANWLSSLKADVDFVGFWTSRRYSWEAYVAHPNNKLWQSPPV